MLKSCSYCGGIHDKKYKCPSRPSKGKTTDASKFRSTSAWGRKSIEIRKRDHYLCVLCYREGRYVFEDVSVHHIESIQNNFNRRLDNYNLITVCRACHELCEAGKIPIEKQLEIANEQEEKDWES